ncbi:hypothetical protein SEA_TRAAWW1_141 [Mycobacterium phage Traaww1]|nr:hypothetical protein SEA_ASRIEL_141 [Mycobacterium phage Asriel]AVI03509.1 hypothetical protein SEA_BARBARIAN_143 [Mycobacterium phage Barbarian]QDH92004.1 hypothetical protein SEA_FLYPOTENUSE_139 [Mycobacterium phage Flypotenuse]QGJ91945.1 hypothetical protein SEA_TRAAWW1_141 [Mycobacterium phage Traaww1]
MKNFRKPNSPVKHYTVDEQVTLCGENARMGARWSDGEAGMDARLWRTCKKCDAALREMKGMQK